MANLRELHCIRVQPGTPPLTEAEIGQLNREVAEWEIVTADSEKRLERKFKFKNFQEALGFTNKVGALADKEDHHPAILTEWGKVTVTWWTHTVHGLHQNDFIMAAKTDALYP
jgi:4a-hydroxytetrahydrobiopterin dehydratase